MNPYGGALTDEEARMLGNPMPRGDGFTRENYFGKPYSTPMQPQPMARPQQGWGQTSEAEMNMHAPQILRQMLGSQASQAEMNAFKPQQLSPEQVDEFKRLLHEERLRSIFNTQRMNGILGQ